MTTSQLTDSVLAIFDGHAVDYWTIGIAFLAVLIRPIRHLIGGKRPCFTRRATMVDFMNGVVVVPFVLLVLASMSSKMLDEVVKTNRFFLAIAGVIGLIFVIGEIMDLEADNTPPNSQL
jgi:hypothetical protein